MDFGTDFDLGLDGFDSQFTLVTGARLVINNVLRRWTTGEETTAGVRIYQGRCRDIRRLLASRFDRARLVALGQELGELAKDDERVEDCAALLEGDSAGKVIRLRAEVLLVGSETPLRLVLPFDSFKPELLNG